ncbi:glucose-1-phosphate thymidylyltransferase [Micromonospora phaseoli]|uniref:Glucose-1-phosphate thymidylyltransferase n=1 Tax=Micromonospora phaseoli TaxID=1144548 RepID=A0A1H7C458_9ACTN|nr:glucose-1-phosphate thymidylyltransferase [Micromonospora phaseoli]PZV92812.1 glucose-1-phosphate thymidylyltransferase [Micromonospora phaseoli]GIJ76532.1 glucose-1-phosphate thymidylyltransferase [Micromonospora phaseoli]SEJ81410.1 glucose-1-phosphate thymidylyltransferase [Micromonospora phaseoli]
MKALVLSGGSGTRLRPLSHSLPKQLVPLANQPLLAHVLRGVRDIGITEVGMVVGAGAEQIRQALGDGSGYGVTITYLPQDAPRGLAHAVRVARQYLGDADFLLHLGDNLLPDGLGEPAVKFRRRRAGAHLLVQKVADPRPYGVVELDLAGRVVRLVEKPRHPRSDLALVGACFLTPVVHQAVEAIRPGPRGELELTDAVQWLVDQGVIVRASEYAGYWRDIADSGDVLAGNRHLLATVEPERGGVVDPFSVLGPRVRVEPGARVIRSRVDGPAIVGAGSVIDGSHLGPYTSVGRGCVIRDSELSGSVVMDEARISGVRRLVDSVVGRAATIERGDPRTGCRVVCGDHGRVEIPG